MKNILITGALKLNSEEKKLLDDLNCNITYLDHEKNIVLEKAADFNIVISNNFFVNNDIKKFEKLEMIQMTSVGLNHLPLEYIKEERIKLYNAEDTYSIPMAEWVISNILNHYKKTNFFYKNKITKSWEKEREIKELNGSKATIIGMGNVGKEVAMRLKSFGVEVIGIGRKKNDESRFLDEYYQFKDMDDATSKSEIIILTLPLNSETFHLIDKSFLENLSTNTLLINVSRGDIIDEGALINSLKNKHISAAFLDVFSVEPLPEKNELWDLENVFISPHNSFISTKNRERLFKVVYKNLKRYLGEI